MEPNIHVVLDVTPSKDGELLLCRKNSIWKIMDNQYVLTLLGRDSSMVLEVSCPPKQYSSSTRFSSYIFILVWWCHDATSAPNLLDCVRWSVKLGSNILIEGMADSWINFIYCELIDHRFTTNSCSEVVSFMKLQWHKKQIKRMRVEALIIFMWSNFTIVPWRYSHVFLHTNQQI